MLKHKHINRTNAYITQVSNYKG